MKKFILEGCLIAVVAVAAGFYISHRMKISNLNDKLQTAIGKDQGITETILKVETESSQMSFSELFELCDKSVKDRTDMLIELRGLYPDMQSVLKDSLIEFLNAENELIRSKSQSYRKYLNVSTGKESYDDLVEGYSSVSYGTEYYRKRLANKMYEVLEDAEDMKDDVQKFIDKYQTLTEKEKSLENIMKNESLRFTPIFSKYQEANIKYMNNSMQYAELVINKVNVDKPTVQKWGYFK